MLTARWILPLVDEPIEGGWIRVDQDRIVEVSRESVPSGAIDLGDAAILPGLVNAHTHLEFSDLVQPVGHPGIRLSAWIAMVIDQRRKAALHDRDDSIERGIRESQESAVTLIGDIATPPCRYPECNDGPEIVSFAEVLGLSATRSVDRMSAANAHIDADKNAGISPHSPYSTTRETIAACVDEAVRRHRPVAMHVAESPDERELLIAGSGPFFESLKAIGVWREGQFPWGERPFHDLIEMLRKSPSALVVHGNDLQDDEISEIAKHSNMTVVYCPRTHAFFGYPPHPVDRCLAAGVPVALGTDSRASNPDLNLWREVQFLLNHRPDLDPQAVLAMATINGADALMRRQYGRIATGCVARFGTVATEAKSIEDLSADFASRPITAY
ncbi:Aminodeoxyfutalosine deaminase [Rubripirellula tenax]|uniref:Aminodeoxyfutalosine deaminase n=1 Tax=Rubripirellula tenax TaxID=2528015 RepID=A0A5C6F566_9BACT|nr:Aminodeoxyfutalosine deaminase [Rubripirellula tenax]